MAKKNITLKILAVILILGIAYVIYMRERIKTMFSGNANISAVPAASPGAVHTVRPGFMIPSGETEIFEAWKSAVGVGFLGRTVEYFSSCTPQELIQRINGGFLMATAALLDQSPVGSSNRNLAERLLVAVEQGIAAAVPTAMGELDRFSEKGKFSERELNWIKFLAGETVKGFHYANCQAFRADSDRNLESGHDYVQVVFPSWAPSQYSNRDLFIRDKFETWKKLSTDCPMIMLIIYLNVQLNAIRMIHFWGFLFDFEQDAEPIHDNYVRTFVIIMDNPDSPLHRAGDHNALRATRFIETLGMFGCFGDLLKIFFEGLLVEYFQGHPSIEYWYKAWEQIIEKKIM
jgi:hypothetical protein